MLRKYPEIDPGLIFKALEVEKHSKDFKVVTNALFDEALQHLDIALAYIDLNLVDGFELIKKFIEKCTTEYSLMQLLIILLKHFASSDDPKIEEILVQFR